MLGFRSERYPRMNAPSLDCPRRVPMICYEISGVRTSLNGNEKGKKSADPDLLALSHGRTRHLCT